MRGRRPLCCASQRQRDGLLLAVGLEFRVVGSLIVMLRRRAVGGHERAHFGWCAEEGNIRPTRPFIRPHPFALPCPPNYLPLCISCVQGCRPPQQTASEVEASSRWLAIACCSCVSLSIGHAWRSRWHIQTSISTKKEGHSATATRHISARFREMRLTFS